MGSVPIPAGMDFSRVGEAVRTLGGVAEVVALAEDLGWNTLDNVARYASGVDAARANGLQVLISLDVLDDGRGALRNLPGELEGRGFSDVALRRGYLREVRAIAETHRPEYLSLGIEMNAFGSDAGLITLAAEAYDEIKRVSPQTAVGMTFQYDTLVAHGQLDLLAGFQDLDFVGLTTYPGLLHPTPEAIPRDYYGDLVGQPGPARVLFSEFGWRGYGTPDGEAIQSAFLLEFLSLSTVLNPEMICWTTLHDWIGGGVFETMGLLDTEGRRKPIWHTWEATYRRSRTNTRVSGYAGTEEVRIGWQ
jgi:hypothetical protein